MKFRSLFSLLLALCLSLAWLPASASATSTILLTLTPDILTGITVPGDDGYVIYGFTPTRTGYYNLTSYSDSDPFVVLLDENTEEIGYNDDGGEGRNFSLLALLAAGKTYYFGMAFYDGGAGTFDVKLTFLGEPSPVPLESDTPVIVSITEAYPVAYYTFTPTQSGRYILSADSQGGDTLCSLFDAQWNQLFENDDSAESVDFSLEADLTAGETYCYAVRFYDVYTTGTFRILLTQSSLSCLLGDLTEDDEVDIFDANLVVAYYNGTASLTAAQQTAADVNGDGEVDIFDANLIVSYYNGTISAFPVE